MVIKTKHCTSIQFRWLLKLSTVPQSSSPAKFDTLALQTIRLKIGTLKNIKKMPQKIVKATICDVRNNIHHPSYSRGGGSLLIQQYNRGIAQFPKQSQAKNRNVF